MLRIMNVVKSDLHPLDVCKALKDTIAFVSKNINFTERVNLTIIIERVNQ